MSLYPSTTLEHLLNLFWLRAKSSLLSKAVTHYMCSSQYSSNFFVLGCADDLSCHICRLSAASIRSVGICLLPLFNLLYEISWPIEPDVLAGFKRQMVAKCCHFLSRMVPLYNLRSRTEYYTLNLYILES